MSTNDQHNLCEQQPSKSLVPALDKGLELSEKEKAFLRHAVRGILTDGVDVDAEIVKQVMAVQHKAYQTYPYNCLRHFRYVSLRMSEHDAFPHILKQGRTANPPMLLDIGCCMGTDLRHLVHSGYNPSSVTGCDLRQVFVDLGYELYADRETCPIFFLVGNVFDVHICPFPAQANNVLPSTRDVRNLNDLRGRVKYVYAGSLFHLFDEDAQEGIARRLATLLDVASGSGPAIVFGRHSGTVVEGETVDALGRTKYLHSPMSWDHMWRRIVGETRLVHVNAVLLPASGQTLILNANARTMLWSVWIGG